MKNLTIILLLWSTSLTAQNFEATKKSLKRAKVNNKITTSEIIEKYKVWESIALYDYNKKEFRDNKNDSVSITISFVDSVSILWGVHKGKLNVVSKTKFELVFHQEGREGLPITYKLIYFDGKNLVVDATVGHISYDKGETYWKSKKSKVRYLWKLKE